MPRKCCFKQIPLESTLMEKIQLNKILMWHLETMEKLKIILNLLKDIVILKAILNQDFLP